MPKAVSDPASLSTWTAEQFDPSLDWEKVARVVKEWDGKVILKGIMDVRDAQMALKVGADAIVVSNHGGRQLDGALSSIKALPAIIDAVGDQIEVHMDGGIRSGQDVLKALALGAKGTYIGRSFVYGLGAMGQAGVTPRPRGDSQRARCLNGALRPPTYRTIIARHIVNSERFSRRLGHKALRLALRGDLLLFMPARLGYTRIFTRTYSLGGCPP